MRRFITFRIFSYFLLPFMLAGCMGSQPTRLYTLSEMPDGTEVSTTAPGPAIGVGPVTLPKYLDRPQIVTHANTNELNQADFDQWGGDLEDNINRVMASNLSKILNTNHVSFYPWRDQAPVDYQIVLDIVRFDRNTNGDVLLDVFWSVFNAKNGELLQMRHSVYRDAGSKAITPATNASTSATFYEAVAAAMSRNLEALSRDIAATITAAKTS